MTFDPFNRLKTLREKEALSPVTDRLFDDKSFKSIDKKALEQLQNEGIEVSSLNEIDDLNEQCIRHQGEMVLIYSRKEQKHQTHAYTFHFLDCSFLKKIKEDKNKTHVCTNRQDGIFLVNIIDEDHLMVEENKETKLKACNHCLSANGGYEGFDFYKHDWKNKADSKDWKLRNDFPFKKFFSTYQQKITKTKHQIEMSAPNEYVAERAAYNKFLKRIHYYVCQECHFDFKAREEYLTVHHIDRDPSNNDLNNLGLLCICCHAEQAGRGHQQLKMAKEYKECEQYKRKSSS